jgi:hypothetical protein
VPVQLILLNVNHLPRMFSLIKKLESLHRSAFSSEISEVKSNSRRETQLNCLVKLSFMRIFSKSCDVNGIETQLNWTTIKSVGSQSRDAEWSCIILRCQHN